MMSEPVEIYRANKLKYFAFLLMSLVFFVAGIWLVSAKGFTFSERLMGFGSLILFGGLAVGCARQLLPGREIIKTSPEGLTIRSAIQTITYRWGDVEGFGVAEFTPIINGGIPDIARGHVAGHRHFPRVGFNFAGSYAGGGLAWNYKDYNQKHYGFDGLLLDNYNSEPEQLARYLNQLKAQYGSSDNRILLPVPKRYLL